MPWAARTTGGMDIALRFQSLFWWKYCPGLHEAPQVLGRSRSIVKFQSLFWWKYCPGVGTTAVTWVELTFQSLFWWKYCPGRAPTLWPGVGGKYVSILVLVEVLPWADVKPAFLDTLKEGIDRFQSLFWWKYCPGASSADRSLGSTVVSILVLVEVLPWGRS